MVTLHLGPVKVTLSFILSQIPGSPITIFEVQIWAVIFNQNILQILDLQQRFFGQGVEKIAIWISENERSSKAIWNFSKIHPFW